MSAPAGQDIRICEVRWTLLFLARFTNRFELAVEKTIANCCLSPVNDHCNGAYTLKILMSFDSRSERMKNCFHCWNIFII